MGGGDALDTTQTGRLILVLTCGNFSYENKLSLFYFAVSFSRSLYVPLCNYFRPQSVVHSSEPEKGYTIGNLVQQRSVTLPGRPARNYIPD